MKKKLEKKESDAVATLEKEGDAIKDQYIDLLERRAKLLLKVITMVRKDPEFCFLHDSVKHEVNFSLEHYG